MQTNLTRAILALQPLFPVPVYFSVLSGHPPMWLSLIIAISPLGIRYWCTRRIITRTSFDFPILVFLCGTLIGFIVSPNKGVATGAFISTLASILVYYGITSNNSAARTYWLWTAGIICLITLTLSLWFLSPGDHRVLFFNQWAFDLFSRLPKTSGPVLQWNTIGALLAVVIPPLFVFAFFNNRKSIRIYSSILWLLFTMILFLSDSGAGWLAVTISLGFILVYWRSWLIWAFILAGALLTGVAVVFYNKTEWLMTTFSTWSLTVRIEYWRNTIILLKDKIVTGLGLGSWYKTYSISYGIGPPHVHNSYLQTYSDTGILGGIAMVLAAIIFVRLSINVLSSSKQNALHWIGIGIIGSIIAGAVFAIFDVTTTITYVTKDGYIYLVLPLLWVGAALISVVNSKLLIDSKRQLDFSQKSDES